MEYNSKGKYSETVGWVKYNSRGVLHVTVRIFGVQTTTVIVHVTVTVSVSGV